MTRAHVLAWWKDLERRSLSGTPNPAHKLAALSSLSEHLCDANAVTHNPVKGVKRPKVESYEGKTPAWATARRGLSSMRRGQRQRRARCCSGATTRSTNIIDFQLDGRLNGAQRFRME